MSQQRVGVIGLGRQGLVDLKAIAQRARVVALCDPDPLALARALTFLPGCATYRDYREVIGLAEVEAVVISTPDHVHVPIVVDALRRGKHCLCQKPLGSRVLEVRRAAAVAAEQGLATQLAIPALFHSRGRSILEILSSGVLGKVRDIFAWTDRPGDFWSHEGAPSASDASLDWNCWLGPSVYREYRRAYHPCGWRAWIGLGSGALGDMGPHLLALPYLAFGLSVPSKIEGDWDSCEEGRYPDAAELHFQVHSAAGWEVWIHWYQGGRLPPMHLFDEMRCDENGCVVVGEKGRCYIADAMSRYAYLLPTARFPRVSYPAPAPPSVQQDWLAACTPGGGPTACGFDGFVSSLSQTLALGLLVFETGFGLSWDAECSKSPDNLAANRLLAGDRRPQW